MLLIASVINILLDLLFTIEFGWGTRGVAIATVIGQGFAAASCYYIIRRHMKNLETNIGSSGYDKKMAKTMLSLGFPAMIQNMITSSGALAVQGLINSFGTALGTYTAQNLGAKKKERIKKGFSYAAMAFMFSCTGVLRGAGDVKIVLICAMLDLGGRVLFAYSMVGLLGRYALWFSYPFGWLCSCALAYPRYFSKKWEKIKVI